MRVALVNDASAQHIGCALVTKTIKEEIAKRGELVQVIKVNEDWRLKKIDADLVIVNGEGTIHHDAPQGHLLLSIANKYPAVLINAVYQNVIPNPALKEFKLISCRESYSAGLVEQHGATARVVPDLMLNQEIERPYQGSGVGFVDSCDLPAMKAKEKNLYRFVNMMGPNFLEKVSKFEGIVCGRFHGLCLAMLWDMPVKMYASNSWKIQGMLHDAGAGHLFADLNPDLIPEHFDFSGYVSNARKEISQLFNDIFKVA
jgi:hypothetical protein